MYFIDRYLNWFRNERIKISLNNKNPKEYRTELGLALLFSTRKRPHSQAIDMFCLITYKQLFWDGNKRMASYAANKILISSGNGMITIIDSVMFEFNELLCSMHSTGDKEKLKKIIHEKALFGLD